MRNFLITYLFTFLTTWSLQAQVEISAKIINNSEFNHVKLISVEANQTVSEANISENGLFKISAKVESDGYYRLEFDEDNTIFLVLTPNEKISISINADKLDSPLIKGSPESERLYFVNNKLSEFASKEQELLDLYEKNKQNQKLFVIEQIGKSPASITNIFFLDFLDMDEDREIVGKMVKAMSAKYPNNKFVIELKSHFEKQNIQKAELVKVGSEAPEITLPDPKGVTRNLSDLRGKIVLIDFWASWCGPCRQENPSNVVLYTKYQKKGFEIFGVSLDKDKASWIKAIETDGLKWTQVSDLKFWASVAAKKYGVKGIPHTVLLDRSGKVISIGLRGKELADKLNEIFNK